jgi:hypothetical protein
MGVSLLRGGLFWFGGWPISASTGHGAEDDGQLHMLGLLERLRSEVNLVRGAYGRVYERVDNLLREIENPNLHDIRNMNFRIDLWDRHALHIRWVIIASGSVYLAHAAFDEAVRQYPDQHLTLRDGIMLMREHPDPRGNPL